MPDMLASGSAWLNGIQKSHSAHTVTYTRGADEVNVRATTGISIFKQVDEYDRFITTESRDYLIAAADLILDSETVEPARGDVIEDNGNLYEVVAMGSESCFRYSDTDHAMLRIHTKSIGVAT